MMKKILLLAFFNILFITSLFSNNCKNFIPIPSGNGFVIVVPTYDINIIAPDLDCDGIIDTLDKDIDGDGIKNIIDKFPRDKTESKDFDNDGIGDNADLDDDNDGLTDVFEDKYYPYLSSKSIDANNNGYYDTYEDLDGDYLNALGEQKYNTNPLLSDTDGDGFTDYKEIDSYKTSPILVDTDGDTLSDGFEIIYNNGMNGSNDPANLDPLNVDSDNDGILDGDELIRQTIWDLPKNLKNSAINHIALLARGDQRNNFKIKINEDQSTGFFKDSNLSFSFELNDNIKEIDLNVVIKKSIQEEEKEEFLAGISNLVFYEKNLDFWIPSSQKVNYIFKFVNGFYANAGEKNGNVAISIKNTDYKDILNKGIYKKSQGQTQYLTKEVSFMVFKDKSFLSDIISQETKICIPKEQINKNTDIVFVLDSSGSMSNNDSSNIRVTASKDFLNAFTLAEGDKIGDRGAVVDFDGSAKLYQSLTTNTSLLEDALDRIDSDGSTNIGAGVDLAINELLSADFIDKNHKVIILLTDGSGSYDFSLTQKARDNNIKILTIGLSSGADNSLLKTIAEETGGIFKQIDTANELLEVFKNFEKTLGDDGSDSDNDGLTDCAEYLGMILGNGNKIETDPNNPDSDGDGLLDGDEITKKNLPEAELEERATQILSAYSNYYNLSNDEAFKNVIKYGLYFLKSDPNKKDSDNDGLLDPFELDLGTNPFLVDSDFDGLSDLQEISYNTDPLLIDTDGDTIDDFKEVNNPNEYNPLTFDEQFNKLYYISQFAKGYVIGDFVTIDTLPETAGAISNAFTPILGDIGNIRDLLANGIKGEYVSASLNLLGVAATASYVGCGTIVTCPASIAADIATDVIKNANTIYKSVKNLKKPLLGLSRQLRGLPASIVSRVAIETLKKLDLKLYIKLSFFGTTDISITRLIKGGKNLENFSKMLDSSAGPIMKIDIASSGIDIAKYGNKAGVEDDFFAGLKGWKLAEEYLRGLDNVADFSDAVKTSTGLIRFPDYWDPANMVMKEVKTGYQSSKKLLEQISRDKKLVADGTVVDMSWHFFPSGRSDSIGASPEILQALKNAKIPYFIHLP